MSAETDEIVEALKRKWTEFQTLLPFKADVPLSERIEAFVEPAREGILQNYPSMRAAPNVVIWEMIFVAVIESGSHPPDEVSRARAVLATKYA